MKTIHFKHIYKSLVCLMLVLLMSLSYAQAQDQTEDEQDNNRQILHIQKLDTRSLSLGDATVADVYGRAGTGVNPALFGLYENKAILRLSAYHNWKSNQFQSYLALPVLSTGAHNFTGRVGFVQYGFDRFNITGDSSLPEPDVNIYYADAAYAFTINDVFSAGVLQSISMVENGSEDFITYSADLGIVYAPDGPVTYGMAFRGLGNEAGYQITDAGETLLSSKLMRQRFELGATLHYPVESRNVLSVSFANEKRFGEEGIWYKAGLEVLPTSFLSLRSGLIFHLDRDVFIPRFGLGFTPGIFSLDYMISPRNIEREYFHQIGLTIQF